MREQMLYETKSSGQSELDLWAALSGSDRGVIEKGEAALVQLQAAAVHGFAYWLDVGAAKERLEEAALNLSGANRPAGKAYNSAFKVLIGRLPHLKQLHEDDKGTLSRALWMHRNREALEEWHGNLEEHEQLRCNHPRIVKDRYEKGDSEAEDGEDIKPKRGKAKHPSAASLLQKEIDGLKSYIIELEDANEALRAENSDLVGKNHELTVTVEALEERVAAAEPVDKDAPTRTIDTPFPAKPRRGIKALDDPSRPRNRANGKTGVRRKTQRGRGKYNWDIAIGKSFVVAGVPQPQIAAQASARTKRYGEQFTTHKLANNRVEVTRVA